VSDAWIAARWSGVSKPIVSATASANTLNVARRAASRGFMCFLHCLSELGVIREPVQPGRICSLARELRPDQVATDRVASRAGAESSTRLIGDANEVVGLAHSRRVGHERLHQDSAAWCLRDLEILRGIVRKQLELAALVRHAGHNAHE